MTLRHWILSLALGLVLIVAIAIGGGYLWLRSSLPQIDGDITVADKNLQHSVTIGRDRYGMVEIRAETDQDAAFALGFAHAQDRLFQMDSMRRYGSGRLSEIIGPAMLATDRRMRILGLQHQAEAQYQSASANLRHLLDAYAAGVNSFVTQQRGALPPEFLLLRYRPEPWSPVDSLIWGRLMALQLSGNWRDELFNARLEQKVPPALFDLLTDRTSQSASIDWLGRSRAASNNWVISGKLTASGKPILANDPHLGLTAPSPWYLARIVTPGRVLTGATAPGLPLLVIGTNGKVAWGFTTTTSDTEDVFDERLSADDPTRYDTPDGPKAFETRDERIKVKGESDVVLTVRHTRHGPVISDAGDVSPEPGHVLALGWAALQPGDRTPDALLAMNRAANAADFEKALRDFAAPQQNIVFADVAGEIGFVAAGRVPIRRQLYDKSLLPVPGWTGATDWTGMIDFDALPQLHDPQAGWIATANNDVSAYAKGGFFGIGWDSDARYRRIANVLTQSSNPLDLLQTVKLQSDIESTPLRDAVRSWLPQTTGGAHADIVAALGAWDGRMDRQRPEPLIATAWLDHLARRILADDLGPLFDDWWFWQIDSLRHVMSEQAWCDDSRTSPVETCRQQVDLALNDALEELTQHYGANWRKWQWGDAHRVSFAHPIWRNVPLLRDWLDAKLPTDGDNATVSRGSPLPSQGDGLYPHIHGATLRFAIDLGKPDQPLFALAGGQSGNPLSSHYDDLLTAWRDGDVRPILQSVTHQITLKPATSVQ
ncbi:penicillin acylase family protein [Dongia soli]|uniref:Penicillin acylase family protein n=1 Tax=Dongia soli TaxID=600628 RepID=A0ABU5EAG1_9PROT|nr:penicillin acylase family protein [Dongia soli]MDY0883262.1 penicillin acylase family protein [Dongia soli]